MLGWLGAFMLVFGIAVGQLMLNLQRTAAEPAKSLPYVSYAQTETTEDVSLRQKRTARWVEQTKRIERGEIPGPHEIDGGILRK